MKSNTSRMYGAAAIVAALALSLLFIPESAYASQESVDSSANSAQAITLPVEQTSTLVQDGELGNGAEEGAIDNADAEGGDADGTPEDSGTDGSATQESEGANESAQSDDASEGDSGLDEGASTHEGDESATASEAAARVSSVTDTNGATFGCAAGAVYSIKSNGGIRAVQRNQSTDTVSTSDVTAWSNSRLDGSRSSSNGLGIGAGGTVAYAYERTSTSRDVSQILKYVRNGNTNQWSLVGSSAFTTGLKDKSLVTGAVDLSSNKYMFGGYDYDVTYSATNYVFKIFMYDDSKSSGQFSYVGYFDTGIARTTNQTTTLNGDMAFNADGDLFVLRSGNSGTGQANSNTAIYVVTKEDLAAAVSDTGSLNPLDRQQFQGKTLSLTGVNGIAFGANGSLYLGTASDLHRYDPNTLTLLKSYPGVLSSSTDLASCTSPSSISLRKDLPSGRIETEDQFTFGLTSPNSTASPVTTTGTSKGIQSVVQGPIPAMPGTEFTVTESMASGANSSLDMYTASWECDDGQSGTLAAGDNKVSVTQSGESLLCTITNDITLRGALAWNKVGTDTSDYLEGSEWMLEGIDTTDPNRYAEKITDCISGTCDGMLDQDNQPGRFLVNDLLYGSYYLTEFKAPDGYEIDPSPKLVVVNSNYTFADYYYNTRVPAATVTLGKGVVGVLGAKISGESVGWTMQTELSNAPEGVNIDHAGSSETLHTLETPDGYNAYALPWTISFPDADTSTTVVVSETFTEAQAKAYTYNSVSCIDESGPIENPTVIIERETAGDDDSPIVRVTVTITGVESGRQILCDFTNQRKPGSLAWEKRGTDDATLPLGGSVWRFTRNGEEYLVVADNVGDNAASTRDVDPRPGYFKVEGMEWGTYTPEEIESPLGYVVETLDETITIDADNLDVVRQFAIYNDQTTVPSIPLTGGTGKDLFIFGGVALLVLAGLSEVVRRLKRSRKGSGM